jgi:transposase
MKQCPACNFRRAYALADGRWKCRRCRRRYSHTSAWDSLRLPASSKRRLLMNFAGGVPAHRQRDSKVSAKTRERFNRVLRACCAREEIAAGTLPAASRRWRGAGLRVVPLADGVQVLPLAGPVGPEAAAARLPLRGRRVVVRGRAAGWPAPRANAGVPDEFLEFARRWLAPYGAVPQEYFHLYLAEICYRFRHRNGSAATGLRQLMRATSIQQLRPLLVRGR